MDTTIEQPIEVTVHGNRAEHRRVMKNHNREMNRSMKHQVKLVEREGMPLSVSADCLSDPKGKTTAAFRKECWRSREKVYTPTAKPKPGYPQRKISEKSFKQLGQSFRRSYNKRFRQIPRRITQLEKLRAVSTETQCLKITQAQNGLRSIAALHDANMKLVNAEIIKRHLCAII